MGKPIPLTPSTQVKGGGQFDFPYDDVTVTITAAKTTKRDYVNKAGETVAKDVPFLVVEFTPDGGEPRSHDFSAGDAKRVQPNEDGTTFDGADGKEFEGLTDTSRAGFFFKKLVDAGFPEAKFGTEVSFLIGTKGHLRQVEPPKNGNKSDEKKVPILTKILALPGESATGGASADQVRDLATKIIAVALKKKNGGPVTKVELSQIANQALDPKVKEGKLDKKVVLEVVKVLLDEKFLKTETAWKSTGTGVTSAAPADDIDLGAAA